jgi:acetyl esterase/lipase
MIFFAVSCFVLSQEPFPALSSALRRFHRRQERVDVRLSTIHESASQRPMANLKGYSKRNVILHLTGGGFFAHTIAGDLPYLLDWSSSSKAVVIVPEYSLSPKKYPEAITEVISIYRALRFGQAAVLLGFQSDRIIVSGESVGGNLATALCVSLIMDNEEDQCVELTHQKSAEMVSDLEDSLSYNENEDQNTSECGCESKYADIPDALLLCCPALNLSLDSTPSRIDGANDPVLPSALISTISASYLGGCPPTDPIASPYYASDSILCSFPPTLIFTSSEDPLLDDSVSFNGRLRSVGVLSRLRAVHDLPHAFWGKS